MFSCSEGSDSTLSTLLFLGWSRRSLVPEVGALSGDCRGGELAEACLLKVSSSSSGEENTPGPAMSPSC